MSTKERQAQFRAKRTAEGRFEVRNIFAYRDDHPAIKAYAKTLLKRRAKGSRK